MSNNNRNIQMKNRVDGNWDNLFPLTLNENVFNDEGIALTDQIDKIDRTVDKKLEKTDHGYSQTLDIEDSYRDLIDRALNTQEENKQNNQIKISTFNIKAYLERGIEGLYDYFIPVLKSEAHIFGTQEVSSNSYFNYNRDFVNSVYPFAYFGKNVESQDYRSSESGSYGVGLNSSLPLVEKEHELFTMLDDRLEQRGWQKVVVYYNNEKVSVYNTHLTHNSDSDLTNQFSQLFNIVESDSNKYKVVIGDFNAVDTNDSSSKFSQFKQAGYTLANKNGEYPTYKPTNKAVDNIIVSPQLEIIESEMITVGDLSDHDLLTVKLELK